jgi:chromosome partitioning protein
MYILHTEVFFMKTLAFANMKGGVGKTSLSAALAAELAKAGNTLLIDGDPQASASGWLACDTINAELADVLFEKQTLEEAVTATSCPQLFILPSFGLGGELKVFAENQAGQKHNCMRKVVRSASSLGYSFCIIDMHPDFGPLERAALIASDEVIVPVMPDAFAVSGLEIFSDNLKRLRADEEIEKPYFSRIIINGIDGRIKLHASVIEKMKSAAKEVFNFYEIPVDPCFRAAQDAGLTIQALSSAKKETLDEIKRLSCDIIKEF